MITVDLPRPPSVNALFHNRRAGGRAKTDLYRAWITQAAWEIRLAARSDRIAGKFGVIIVLGGCGGRSPDVDNMIKPIVDALVRASGAPAGTAGAMRRKNSTIRRDDAIARI